MITICVFRSKLRYLGLLTILPAVWTQESYSKPILVISEDARQVAAITEDNGLAVNRKRPNSFILKQWVSAYKSKFILKPNAGSGFNCTEEGYCKYINPINNINKDILYIENKEYYTKNSKIICSQYSIAILAYSPSADACTHVQLGENAPLVITQQQLALYGSVEIRQDPERQSALIVQFALGEASRPWQSHRKFSRPARNLAPYQRSNQ